MKGDDLGRSPLHMACTRGYYDCIALLLDYGADVNYDFNGVNMVHCMYLCVHVIIVNSFGCRVNRRHCLLHVMRAILTV